MQPPLKRRIEELKQEVRRLSGLKKLDLCSPKEVGDMLFQTLGLPVPSCAMRGPCRNPSTTNEVRCISCAAPVVRLRCICCAACVIVVALMLLLLSNLEPQAYKSGLHLMWRHFALAKTKGLSAILEATRLDLQQPLIGLLHKLASLHNGQAFARNAVAPQ